MKGIKVLKNMVSICLINHVKCPGEYISTSGKYLLKCGCICHSDNSDHRENLSGCKIRKRAGPGTTGYQTPQQNRGMEPNV